MSEEKLATKPGSTKNAAVAAAIARAKAKKLAEKETNQQTKPNNEEAIAARKVRKEKARLNKEKRSHQIIDDDKQNQINAAVAKAKAKKIASKDQ